MNCTEFDQHWRRRLDVGAGQTSVNLLEHLEECPRCQDWHRAWETLERAIDQSSGVDPVTAPGPSQPDLVDRVLVELQSGPGWPPEPVCSRPFVSAAVHPAEETDQAHVDGSKRRSRLRVTALASALLLLGIAWFHRPLAMGPQPLSPLGMAATKPLAESRVNDAKPAQDEPSAHSREGELASSTSMPGESIWNELPASPQTPRPPIVKPLVGVVHNLTSLVLPGWPSMFNDSVGIPHCFEGEGFDSLTRETTSPPIPAPLALVRGTEVAWPEPVEELLAVATESVQTMWDLASRW